MKTVSFKKGAISRRGLTAILVFSFSFTLLLSLSCTKEEFTKEKTDQVETLQIAETSNEASNQQSSDNKGSFKAEDVHEVKGKPYEPCDAFKCCQVPSSQTCFWAKDPPVGGTGPISAEDLGASINNHEGPVSFEVADDEGGEYTEHSFTRAAMTTTHGTTNVNFIEGD